MEQHPNIDDIAEDVGEVKASKLAKQELDHDYAKAERVNQTRQFFIIVF